MGKANRVVGYLAGVTSASIVYMLWFMIAIEASALPDGHPSGVAALAVAFFFWLLEGMALALLLLAIPWSLTVLYHDQEQRLGPLAFALIAAGYTLVLGCATSSLAPKPFFVEDQTFAEGFMIAVQRQGLCFALTGLAFGLTFWLVSERCRPRTQAPHRVADSATNL